MQKRTVSLLLILFTLAALVLGVSVLGLQTLRQKEEVPVEE